MTAKTSTAANENAPAESEALPASDVPPETLKREASAEASVAAPQPAPKRPRRWRRTVLMVSVPLLLLAGGTYAWVSGGRYEETDNANLRQATVEVTSEVAGRIASVDVSENQQVKKGDTLFVIDPQPYQIALGQADAAIASARLSVEQLRAAYSQAVSAAKVDSEQVDFLQSELDRQTALTKSGVGTKAALDQARNDLAKAKSGLAAAQQAIVGAQAALGGDPNIETDKHPAVMAAIAAHDQAAFNLAQTTVHSPSDGVVYQAASVRPGQFAAIGVPLFALVETGESWVDANFKETQLTHMRVGQPADITLDAFPDRALKATVESIGAGTGAEFSVLPAQNATGNWVKVTQRIPVRFKVEAPEDGLLLRTGMSASVEVDTGKSRGWDGLVRQVEAFLPSALVSQSAQAAE